MIVFVCRAELSVLQAVEFRPDNSSVGSLVQYIAVTPGDLQNANLVSMTQRSMSVTIQLQRSPLHVQVVISYSSNVFAFLGQLLAYVSGVYTAAGLTLWLLERIVLACSSNKSKPLLSPADTPQAAAYDRRPSPCCLQATRVRRSELGFSF